MGRGASVASAVVQTYLMCPPRHFEVAYAINPWMEAGAPVDRPRAMRQWQELKAVHESFGHTVLEVEPCPAAPDMVFTANAGTVIGGVVLPARFRHPQRRVEEAPFRRWFEAQGLEVVEGPLPVNEGEGDLLLDRGELLAGVGLRTDAAVGAVAEAAFGVTTVPLELVDPRYYHLDTALALLGEGAAAYLPDAFSPASRRLLARRFPDAVLATAEEAATLALNMVGDGHHVVVPVGAPTLAARVAALGLEVHEVDVGELVKAGGAAKCATLVLRERDRPPPLGGLGQTGRA